MIYVQEVMLHIQESSFGPTNRSIQSQSVRSQICLNFFSKNYFSAFVLRIHQKLLYLFDNNCFGDHMFKAWSPKEIKCFLFDNMKLLFLTDNHISQENLKYLLKSWNNETIPNYGNNQQNRPTNLNHGFDPREWLTNLTPEFTQENDPWVWPRSLTHENNPRIWPASLTYECDQWVWPTRITHGITYHN